MEYIRVWRGERLEFPVENDATPLETTEGRCKTCRASIDGGLSYCSRDCYEGSDDYGRDNGYL